MNENDLRVVKTRRGIEGAMILLLGRKSFEKITVQDLLDEALVNRTTFYKHYADKYALAERLCAKWLSVFKADVDARFRFHGAEDVTQAIEHLYRTFAERRVELLRLFTIHTETIHLYDDMSAYLQERFLESYRESFPTEGQLDYLAVLYASLAMTSIKWCLEHGGSDRLLPLFPQFQAFLTQLQMGGCGQAGSHLAEESCPDGVK